MECRWKIARWREAGDACLMSQKTIMVAREATILRAIPALYLFNRLQMPRAAYTPICGPPYAPLSAHISADRARHREHAQLLASPHCRILILARCRAPLEMSAPHNFAHACLHRLPHTPPHCHAGSYMRRAGR